MAKVSLRMEGQFWADGFKGVTTFIDCWPCETCGRVTAVSTCEDEDGSICEITVGCYEEADSHYCSVRPTKERRFEFSTGKKGWWTYAEESQK